MPGAPRSFRFGVEMMEPFAGMTWADSARELEALGYSALHAPDHFDEGLGPIAAMASAAAVTENLVVATAVLAADFRHPAVLARELAAIDVLSAGRLEVGLGAGYNVDDYRWSGIPMDPPKVRVDRLEEYVAVLRGLFAPGPFTFDGDHFHIDSLDGTPHPHTPGGPPILVAGGGPRMLRFAARHADIVGVNPSLPTSERRAEAARDGVAARIDEKFALVREAAGARYEHLEFHGWLREARVTDDGRGAAREIAAATGLTEDDVLSSPFVLVGSVDEIVERLEERRARWGYSYYTVQQPAARDLAAVVAAVG
ncbi:MAG TPA: TIGR03621 family F420-dependent LLM class oxidoreductase [Solirubrobacterales bacterium]|nr:TIGR03621 family F420-dependent LLM class oxidoreductase [Solirubrobacterales bacterium]